MNPIPLLALLLLMTGAAHPAAAQEDPFPILAAEVRAGEGALEPCAFGGLQGRARCGRFRVPEDREAASGRTIDIAFVILDALDPAARTGDGIVLLPGGPGESFTDGAVPISRIFPELRRTRDVVLVDVRGVGRSEGLSCTVPYPGGLRSRFGALFPLDHVAACRDELSARARLDRYTTASSVDDLEEIRRWLGYEAWNLLGGSYGTRVAQVYMRRHPGAARVAVLNGVAPLYESSYVQDAFLLERTLDRLLAECAADAACGEAFPDLEADLARLFAAFREGPLEVEIEGERVPFSFGDLSYALRGLLYGRAAELPLLISRAADGDVGPLARYYVERTGWVGGEDGYAGYHFSVLCAEDIALVDDEDVERWTAGTFMGDHLIRGYREACGIWPHAELPPSYFEPVSSDVPTLLLSGGRDPVTPPEGGEAVASHLPVSLHVVVPNGGHGVGGPCVEAMVVTLVETASLEGVDTSCVEAAPPVRFRLPNGS